MSHAPKPNEKGERFYGSHSQNREDKARCITEIWQGFSSYQCRRKRVVGDYCRQHDPAAVEAKRKAEAAKWDAEQAVRQRIRDGERRMREFVRNAASLQNREALAIEKLLRGEEP